MGTSTHSKPFITHNNITLKTANHHSTSITRVSITWCPLYSETVSFLLQCQTLPGTSLPPTNSTSNIQYQTFIIVISLSKIICSQFISSTCSVYLQRRNKCSFRYRRNKYYNRDSKNLAKCKSCDLLFLAVRKEHMFWFSLLPLIALKLFFHKPFLTEN